jgi:hypothetical protein
MNTQEAASLATKEANPVIDGRKANVNLAYLGAKPRVIPSPAGKFRFQNQVSFARISLDKKYNKIINDYPFSLLINCSTSSMRNKLDSKWMLWMTLPFV